LTPADLCYCWTDLFLFFLFFFYKVRRAADDEGAESDRRRLVLPSMTSRSPLDGVFREPVICSITKRAHWEGRVDGDPGNLMS